MNFTRTKLIGLTLKELRQLCKNNNIKKYSNKNKEELISYIINYDINNIINNIESLSISFNIDDYLKNMEKYISTLFTNIELKNKNNINIDILDNDIIINKLKIAEKLCKNIQMKYGELWQHVIGSYKHFINLKNGDNSGLDIKSIDKKIIIELKNSFNTDNSSSKKANYDKLSKYKENNKEYTCIYGVINSKKSESKIIIHNEVEILYLSGDKLFDFIFDENKTKIVDFIKNRVKYYTTVLCN
jgi:hypothetical protein